MNPLDIICLIILALLFLRGIFRGFVKEFSSVAAVLSAVLLAVFFSGLVATLLDQFLEPSFWNQIIAFLAIFMIVYIVFKLFEAGLKSLVERAKLESLDKALGLFLGLLEGFIVVFVILFILHAQPFIPVDAVLNGSIFNRLLSPLFPYANELISQGG